MLHAGTTQLGFSYFMTHPICADKRIRSNLRRLHNEWEQKIGWREHTECLWWPLSGFFYGKPFPLWKQEEGLQALHSPRPHLNRNICILVENINSEWFLGLVGSILPCCHIELASEDLPLANTPQRYPQASQWICTGKNTLFFPIYVILFLESTHLTFPCFPVEDTAEISF